MPFSLLKYLKIVEWAGRQQRAGKRGSIPNSLEPIFERIGFSSTGFLESMLRFAEPEPYFESTERQGQPERFFAEADTAERHTEPKSGNPSQTPQTLLLLPPSFCIPEAEKLIKSILERHGSLLYRKPAKQMLERLQAGDSLPTPEG